MDITIDISKGSASMDALREEVAKQTGHNADEITIFNEDLYALDPDAVFGPCDKAFHFLFSTTPTKVGDPSESESEDEPEGDCCAGATDPRIVITYTMAGGGSHWWNYEVHYDADGEQEAVYINNKNGKEYKRGERLFHHEEHPDQLRIEARDFEHKDWHEMVHSN